MDPLALITLINQYDVLLKEYDTQVGQLTVAGSPFTQLPGRSWWGTTILGKRTGLSLDDCQQWCHGNYKCSGATFTNSGSCTIVQGNSPVVVSAQNTAIVRSQYDKINNLVYMNQQLADMNQQLVSMCQGNPVQADAVQQQTRTLDAQRNRLDRELKSLHQAQKQAKQSQEKAMAHGEQDTKQMDAEYLRAHALIGVAALAVVITAYRLI